MEPAQLLNLLIVLMSADIVTGSIAAGMEGCLSSKASFNGVSRKVLIILLLYIVASLEPAIGIFAHIDAPVVEAIILWAWGTEAISILENLNRAGIVSPAWLQGVFEKWRAAPRKADDDGD